MNKDFWKKILPYIGSILLFAVISFGYFAPDIFEGKVLFQHDARQGIANGEEIGQFYKKTGERTRWTNSLFGGMPTYQIAPGYDSLTILRKVEKIYDLYIPSPAGYIFVMLLGFFILMKALRVRTLPAVMGAVAYAFSSYFFIIISAGHIWKFITLAYIPPTIAGIILIYQGRYWLGAIVTALFLSLQILSNHVQMSYYFGFVILAFLIAAFTDAIQEKKLVKFFKSTGILLIAVLVAICANISSLYHTYEYSKQTIRGAAELTHNAENQTSSGLDRDYVVQWSYGKGETWSLLIPNVKGGASGYLGNDEEAMKKADGQYKQVIGEMNHYWGDQPGTSGPVYVGAFIFALFVLGLFILKGNLKWTLLAVTILTILLSWGKNFMPLTDFFLDYLPMYNKFRAVSSILVVAEFTIPLLAILTLKEILENPGIIKEKKKLFWSGLGIVSGIVLLFALFPSTFFDFLSAQEKDAFLPQAQGNPQVKSILDNLQDVRIGIFRADAWRSFFIIAIGIAFLVAFLYKKVSATVLVVCLTVLCFFDMASVDKRYLNGDNFVTKKETKEPYPETAADRMILQDKTLYYRVLNRTVDTFNDASTSYRHKSVGGYHAVKLRRYQDLIEHQLTKGNMEVYNMLNTKYIIVPDQSGQATVMQNPDAYGNAWFVDEIKWVNNADEEMNALTGFNALRTAVVDKRFENELANVKVTPKDSLSSIVLTEYEPNKLVFKSRTNKDELAVFSDIYYPGWKATIDGKEVPIARANYVLRTISVPSGEHTVVFTFDPQSIHTTEVVAYASIILLLLACVGYVGYSCYKAGKKKKEALVAD